ncbi:MAG TPA: DUF4212 domain-containing protein, partial [Rhodoferax sp.]|nr:DUF4212 domain-containing protein [Rhodoferax sp.]
MRLWLLLAWFLASFGVVFFAHDLQQVIAGWPLAYWFAAQGSVLVFIALVAIYAWFANRADGIEPINDPGYGLYLRRIHRRFIAYVILFLLLLLLLALAERAGLRKIWVGAIFL